MFNKILTVIVIVILAACAVLFIYAIANAEPIPCTGLTVPVAVTQPSTNEDGSPLIDWAGFRVFANFQNPAQAFEVYSFEGGPAWAGQACEFEITLPAINGKYDLTAEVWDSCTDTQGNPSPNLGCESQPSDVRRVKLTRPGCAARVEFR